MSKKQFPGLIIARTMAEQQEAESADVKSAQDVLKMSGNDELKFGVLIGLIKVGQVSNKDVVDTVLNLVSTRWIIVLLLYIAVTIMCVQGG